MIVSRNIFKQCKLFHFTATTMEDGGVMSEVTSATVTVHAQIYDDQNVSMEDHGHIMLVPPRV